MPAAEVYVRDDTPANELELRIRLAVMASLPPDVRVRQWGSHTAGTRLADTNMVRYYVEYTPER